MTGKTTATTNEGKKFWDIKNISADKAELFIYGDIEPFQIVESDVTAYAFAEDLRSVGEVAEIDLRINSSGGDVFSAQAIYSLLRSHNAKITAYIDGIGASAASFIPMAADTIYIPKNALMMIHNPLMMTIGNRNDLLKTVEVLDRVKDTIIAAYENKTGKDRQEISDVMDEEKWMTGEEAVENGFADELLDEVEAVAKVEGNYLIVNNIKHDLSKLKNISSYSGSQTAKTNTEEEKIMNLEELKEKYPEIYNQAMKAGADQENERIKAIEEMQIPGNETLVNNAKFETRNSAEKLAVDIIKAQKEQGSSYLKNREEDAGELNNIFGGEAPEDKSSEEQKNEDFEKVGKGIADFINSNRGGAK
ncbi:ATP-dependent protease ClpP, protease subunit [Salibacterium halotolerans]|uniref:ATP-dependent Clp protease proteolytic subunit n=2 Tax=Salibacterium halotolerans TaxID=1884432 RepID=A0A1I5MMM2_9BACI|nr:ATP-dependent protease ClpP, protease subunit [Salibacterium halotolerans]